MPKFVIATAVVLIAAGALFVLNNYVLYGMPLEMLIRASNEVLAYSQAAPQPAFFDALKKPSIKGKLFFQENAWLSLLDLDTGKVIRTRPMVSGAHSHRLSADGLFLSFVVGTFEGPQTRHLYAIANRSVRPIAWEGAYEKREVTSFDAEGKPVINVYPTAHVLHGGSGDLWYGLRQDFTRSRQPASVFRYDGGKYTGADLTRLPTDLYYFGPDSVRVDGKEEYLYVSTSRLIREDGKPKRSEPLLLRVDLRSGAWNEYVLSKEDGFNSYAPEPASNRLWIYAHPTFYLLNSLNGKQERVVKAGAWPKHWDVYAAGYLSDYFDGFVASIGGDIYAFRKEGTEVFGVRPFYRVYRVDGADKLETVKKIYGLGQVQWVP